MAVAVVAPSLHAGMTGFSWERPDTVVYDPELPGGPFTYHQDMAQVNDMAGVIQSLNTSYDTATDEFAWSVTFDGQPGTTQFHQTQGFWLVVTDGEMPSSAGGQTAQFFFDASGGTPVLSAYAYNGLGDGSSFMDGSSMPGVQSPDPIFSSLNDPLGDIVNSLSVVENNGLTTMSFAIDADVVNEHNPLFPNGNGNPWQGLGFSDTVGIWFHPVTNVKTTYNQDGTLDCLDFARHGWWDGSNLPTVESAVPAPGALVLLTVAGFAGRRRRR